MNTLNKITLDGIEYVRADKLTQPEYNGQIKIIVLQRGWVLIGQFEKDGTNCKLHNASVIRNWGTTKGLGELATNGKLKDTKLDKCGGLVEFDVLTVVLSLSVNEALWKKEL